MPMSVATCIAVYLTIWWTTLFAVLPLGARSHAEAGIPVPGGGDPSSPVNPNLKRKFVTTTWVSAVLFAVLWLVLYFHLVTLPSFSQIR
jgi:predicted secreted protein